jgi:hypothetical protein
VGLDGETVRKRIHRFNAEGLEALKDRHRSGRQPTYLGKPPPCRECAHEASDARVAVCGPDAGLTGRLPARAQGDCDAAQLH